jgi:hypothetical protein
MQCTAQRVSRVKVRVRVECQWARPVVLVVVLLLLLFGPCSLQIFCCGGSSLMYSRI